ncbi:flavohemoprotein [Microbispora sp. RL4-1S]|uniref:nitric oxide dioxygenase n=1 Tax=Microbispora oryzae TaxID=2806554 RepID=A0A940WHL0_9ACTN|nr:globin domain-containing protein [Microbispora oryzae]MBP2704147.1 flavohemoprotein [Microbispora oryzae]
MSLNPRLVKESFSVVEPVAEEAAAYFYGRLFSGSPRLRAMFPPAMGEQRERLFAALTRIVWMADNPEGLSAYLGRLGRDHRKYGVVAEHYTAFGDALIATIRRFAAEIWTPEMEAAWAAAYRMAADMMKEAAEADAEAAPPWWPAEVVAHERRTRDIAIVTVRPSQRMDFRPGQHVALQTARWPRVWRAFSIANAPRADDTLSFHVKAVPGGWVSSSLVRETRIGDQVLLGPPAGTMVPPDSGRDILCVAGGTGLAPLKAIVEHVVEHTTGHTTGPGRVPGIHLLFGARHAADLYDLDDLIRMESGHPRLRVLPVVSDEPDYDGITGSLPDVMERLRPWGEHEVYVCGPAPMVDDAVSRLRRSGVPTSRIHHDSPYGAP